MSVTVPRRVSGVPCSPRPVAGAGGGAAPGHRGSRRRADGPPAGRSRPGGLCLRGARAGRERDRREDVGAVRARQGLARDLQLHVPARSRRRSTRAAGRRDGAASRSRKARARPAWRSSISSTARWSMRGNTSISPSSRRRRCSASSPSPRSEAGGGCACCPRPRNTYNRDYLGETAEGSPKTDAERLPSRWRHDPPLLGLGAVLRADRARSGPSPRRHARARLEPVRSHPRGTGKRVGRTAVATHDPGGKHDGPARNSNA